MKANWIDRTHARNVVSAKLAGRMQEKYGLLMESPNHGAVDGFPVEIYNNGKFYGLYTFNIPKDTWQFAHKYIGRLWYLFGCAFVPISFFVMFTVIGKDNDTVGTVGAILCFVQMIPLLGWIIPTEKALKKNFDNNGKRK